MNKYFSLAALTLTLALSAVGLAQSPTPTPGGQNEDVVRISTSLVQIDVLVTDKDGKQITDLKQSDFELLQDGKIQKVTKFAYIGPNRRAVAANTAADQADQTLTAASATNAGSGSGRLVTFIVDDGNCIASQAGILATRDALEKFVNRQMQPNDRVAIYQTRSGSSMLQQYTSDKQVLLRAVKRIRWVPPGGGCTSFDGAYYEANRSNTISSVGSDGAITSKSIESEQDRKRREAAEDFSKNNQTIGTIGVINYVVRGLESVPGRKMVILLSDGLSIRDRTGISTTALSVLRELTDRANRGSVLFNTINVRGTFDPGMVEARDEVDVAGVIDTAKPSGTSLITSNRERDTRLAAEGMAFLANETGGRYFQGANNLDGPIDKALSLERGYYLLGYEPDDDSFNGKDFHKIDVRVKRPDAKVATRAGFLAKPDTDVPTRLKSADSELYQAIAAPLPKAGLDLRMTAFFGNTPADGNYIRSMIALRGSDITFSPDPSGAQKAVFDVVAVTLDEKNKVIDEFNRTHTLKVDPRTAEVIRTNGLVYSVDVPVKKEGTYNFRVAMRDASNKVIGSAGQAISIPDLKKGQLVVSGLAISELDADGKFGRPSLTKPDNGFSMLTSKGGPVTRQFKRPSSSAYSYTIFNGGTDASQLTLQVNLYKDGKLVSEGQPKKIESSTVSPGRIDDLGFLRLNAAVETGEYTLEVIVRDPGRKQIASQTVDFEIID